MKNVFMVAAITLILLSVQCKKSETRNNTVHKTEIETDNTLYPGGQDASRVNSFADLIASGTRRKSEKTLAKFMHNMQPLPQFFSISPSEKSVITGEEGTVLTFDKNSFVHATTGEPVTGEVEISLTEYLAYDKMLAGNLNTMCNGNLLETGGMVYIEATAGGEKVSLKNGSYYQLEMPAKAEAQNMQLFYGEQQNDRVNWVTPDPADMMMDNMFPDAMRLPKSPKYPGGLDSLYTYLNENVVLPEELQGAKAAGHNYFTIVLKPNGKVKEVSRHLYIKTYADREIEKVLMNSPAWNMPASAEDGTTKTVNMPINIKWIAEPSLIPTSVKANYLNDYKKNYASFALSKYVLMPSKLGWINCDKFIRNTNNIDLFVQIPDSDDFQAKLLFQSFRSLYDGVRVENGVVFRKVPLNADITIVAMKCENEKFYVATQFLTATRDNEITNLDFKEVNEAELAEVFKKLANPVEIFASK
ncbi:MAG: hypothetical protein ACKVPJ_07575 [Chitinophagales bacterium]